MKMKGKSSIKDYAGTGLKLIVLSFVAGLLGWIVSLLLGVGFLTIFQGEASVFVTFIFAVFMLFVLLVVNGWLAQKMWKWK
jgi:hypothetical protein